MLSKIGRQEEIQKLMFPALAFRSDEKLSLETSAYESLYGG